MVASWLIIGAAMAQALSISPTLGVVPAPLLGLRPGVRLGLEPTPLVALELQGDAGLEQRWDAGLGIAGRLWLLGAPGDALFLLGRMTAGMSGDELGGISPWLNPMGGFGGRISERFNVEASLGPEWGRISHSRWRTELSVGIVLDGSLLEGRSGVKRHRPRKP